MTPRGTHRANTPHDHIEADTDTSDDASRAVAAIYASTPGFLLSPLGTGPQLDEMLHALKGRFPGRRLADITTSELQTAAREAIEEVHDLPRPAEAFPAPVLTGESDAQKALRAVQRALALWEATGGPEPAIDVLHRIRQIISDGGSE